MRLDRKSLHREVHQQHRQLLGEDERELHPGRDHVQAGQAEEGGVRAGHGQKVHNLHRRLESSSERCQRNYSTCRTPQVYKLYQFSF